MDLPPISLTESETDSSTGPQFTERKEDPYRQWATEYGRAFQRGVDNPVNRYLLEKLDNRIAHQTGELLDRREWALGSHPDVMAFAEPPEGVKVRSIAENTILAASTMSQDAMKETVEWLSLEWEKKHCVLIGHKFVPLPMVEERTSDGRALNKIDGKKHQCDKCWNATEECMAWSCAREQCGFVVCGKCEKDWQEKGKEDEM